jgi:hypothetical protein
LTEKYSNLSQQMDQLIHDANAQIKNLQDKIQCQFCPSSTTFDPMLTIPHSNANGAVGSREKE